MSHPTRIFSLEAHLLNEKQLVAIELLAAGSSFVQAAKELEVDRRTLFRWRQEEQFRQRLRERHREMWATPPTSFEC